MARRRPIQAKIRSSSNGLSRRQTGLRQCTSSSALSLVRPMPSENLDDETKLAKRHLTKEMWQLVSIAVKRMADELVSISNNQQATVRPPHLEPPSTISTSNPPAISQESIGQLPTQATVQQPIVAGVGAGDTPVPSREKLPAITEPLKKRMIPIDILEPSMNMKRKATSNNATRRAIKCKVQNRATKKNEKKGVQRVRSSHPTKPK